MTPDRYDDYNPSVNKIIHQFSVWSPSSETMTLQIVHPYRQEFSMLKGLNGYFTRELEIVADTRYFYRPHNNNKSFPDPRSHFQPEGVHGPSEIIFHNEFRWNDQDWKGYALSDLIFYELHVGTFTEDGTFEAIIPRLDDLIDTGINAIELMPLAQFPGTRNWGYDGAYPFAVQNSYGGPEGFKALVNACHQKGIAVFLDVVYNHLGPEGNYFEKFGPYFSGAYKVFWGDALNFDGEWSDGVRDFFLDNITHWFTNYHVDGLRVDAIHAIFDNGATPILQCFSEHTRRLSLTAGRSLYLVAESDLNSPRVMNAPENGGYGFHAQWLDDFHHAWYVLLDPGGKKRYADFGKTGQLAKAYKDGFVHSGEYVSFRKKKYGASSAGLPGDKFIAFHQNHDQIGNRVHGERLASLVSFGLLKIAAAGLFLSPYVPLLFMGEEYGEEAPFLYFNSHSDPALVEAVREGRRKEFEAFKDQGEPADPQDERTFLRSKLQWQFRSSGKHQLLRAWYSKLASLRREYPVFKNYNKADLQAWENNSQCFTLLRQDDSGIQRMTAFFNLSHEPVTIALAGESKWNKILDSADAPEGKESHPMVLDSDQKFTIGPQCVVAYLSANVGSDPLY